MSTQSLIHKTKAEFLCAIDKIFVLMVNNFLLKKRFLIGEGMCKEDFIMLCSLKELIMSSNCELSELFEDLEENLNLIILKYQ